MFLFHKKVTVAGLSKAAAALLLLCLCVKYGMACCEPHLDTRGDAK